MTREHLKEICAYAGGAGFPRQGMLEGGKVFLKTARFFGRNRSCETLEFRHLAAGKPASAACRGASSRARHSQEADRVRSGLRARGARNAASAIGGPARLKDRFGRGDIFAILFLVMTIVFSSARVGSMRFRARRGRQFFRRSRSSGGRDRRREAAFRPGGLSDARQRLSGPVRPRSEGHSRDLCLTPRDNHSQAGLR